MLSPPQGAAIVKLNSCRWRLTCRDWTKEVKMARIAIITGAASGIGQAPASTLVTQGYTVVVDDISGTGTERAVGELAWHGGHDV